MRVLLCVMNARAIPECVASYEALDCDVAWMTGYTIAELADGVHRDIVDWSDHDAILNVSDDCVVTQDALDAVVELLAGGHPAATGWCSLVRGHRKVNLCRAPLLGDTPRIDAYSFYTAGQVMRQRGPAVTTHFMGMSLTGMWREMWQRFPYGCFTKRHERGHSSDFHLSARLRDAGVPMVAARDGWVDHLKTRRNHGPGFRGEGTHRLLVGEIPQEVRIVRRDGTHKMLRGGHDKTATPTPAGGVEALATGGGWYTLPSGRKVRGRDAAERALAEEREAA